MNNEGRVSPVPTSVSASVPATGGGKAEQLFRQTLDQFSAAHIKDATGQVNFSRFINSLYMPYLAEDPVFASWLQNDDEDIVGDPSSEGPDPASRVERPSSELDRIEPNRRESRPGGQVDTQQFQRTSILQQASVMSTISRESSLLPEQQRSVQDDGWFDHLFGEDLKLRSEGHCSSLIYDYVCTSIKLLEAKNRELESKLERKLNQYPKVQTRSKKVKDENDESQETDHSTLLEAEVSNIAENIVSSSTAKRQSQLDLWRTSCKALLDELLFES